MIWPNRSGGGVSRPKVTTNGSFVNPQVGDIWTLVTPAGVEASDYSMMQNRGAGPVMLTLVGVNHTVTSADIGPLGSDWPVTVRDIGLTLVSLPQSVTNPPAIPGAPTIGMATAGSGTVTAPYTAAGSNGGAAITKYTAYLFDAGGNIVQIIDNAPSPVIFSSVANGGVYRVRVLAVNSVGPGPLSAFSNAVTPAAFAAVAEQAITHNLVFAGDSYIAGNGPTGLNGSFPLQMQRGNVLNNMAITNTAIAGQTISNLRSNRVAQIDSRYVAGKRNVLITDGGLRNTICAVNSTTTGAQGCAEFKLLLNEILAVHPDWIIIIVGTIATYSQLASGLSVATANTELQNANDQLLLEFPTLPGVGGVVNLRENSAFVWQGGSTPTAAQTPFYSTDLVHPVEEGCALEKASTENVVRNNAALRVVPTLVPEAPVLSSFVEQSGAVRFKIAQPTGGGLVENYVITDNTGALLTDSAAGTNGWDRTISGLTNGVAKQVVITPVNTVGAGVALTVTVTPKALITQLYNFEADTVGAAPANVNAINGALVVSNTGTANATKSVYMPAQPADTKAGVFEMTNLIPQAADQTFTFKRTCAVAGANDTQFFAVRLQNTLSTVAGFENFRCGYYVRVRATGLLRLYRLDAAALVQIQPDQTFNQATDTNFSLSMVDGLFQVRINGALKVSKLDFTYADGRNLIRFEVGDASVAYLDDMQLVS